MKKKLEWLQQELEWTQAAEAKARKAKIHAEAARGAAEAVARKETAAIRRLADEEIAKAQAEVQAARRGHASAEAFSRRLEDEHLKLRLDFDAQVNKRVEERTKSTENRVQGALKQASDANAVRAAATHARFQAEAARRGYLSQMDSRFGGTEAVAAMLERTLEQALERQRQQQEAVLQQAADARAKETRAERRAGIRAERQRGAKLAKQAEMEAREAAAWEEEDMADGGIDDEGLDADANDSNWHPIPPGPPHLVFTTGRDAVQSAARDAAEESQATQSQEFFGWRAPAARDGGAAEDDAAEDDAAEDDAAEDDAAEAGAAEAGAAEAGAAEAGAARMQRRKTPRELRNLKAHNTKPRTAAFADEILKQVYHDLGRLRSSEAEFRDPNQDWLDAVKRINYVQGNRLEDTTGNDLSEYSRDQGGHRMLTVAEREDIVRNIYWRVRYEIQEQQAAKKGQRGKKRGREDEAGPDAGDGPDPGPDGPDAGGPSKRPGRGRGKRGRH